MIDIAVVVTMISFAVYIFIMAGKFPTRIRSESADGTITRIINLEPIDPIISFTLPHNQYVHLQDSIKFQRRRENGDIGSAVYAILIGAQVNERYSSLDYDHPFGKKVSEKDYFITLNWWQLNLFEYGDERLVYYVKNGQSFLRKMICGKELIKDYHGKSRAINVCREIEVKIPFKYSEGSKAMLIPVSKTTYNVLQPVFIVAVILYFFYFVFFILGNFIKFLLEIAGGTPFSETNVSRLRMIALNLLLIPLGLFLINLLLRLIFYKYFTSDLHMSPDQWSFYWKPLILSGIFAALYIAFRKGKQLQEDNDLTV